ncbi:MAG: hypothetical protein LBS05_01340 [Tannerellaceae bacterium]|jgi:hypothetical protein|nr:hypothetical protein [Tannerellaceae bacterium]
MKRSLHITWHLLLGLAAVGGFGGIVQLLWNALLPQILGIATISFWQALGLFALCRILFGSFGGRHWMGHAHTHFHNNIIREKWMSMTPEERKKFIQNRHHFNHGFNQEPEKIN